jgi:hypothetical protein
MIELFPGGSEASPTWAKSPVNIVKKSNPGDVVNRDIRIEKVSETNRSDHLGSFAAHFVPE